MKEETSLTASRGKSSANDEPPSQSAQERPSMGGGCRIQHQDAMTRGGYGDRKKVHDLAQRM